MKDGIYKSDDAIYFVKNGKIIMKLMGTLYKTTENFMQGTYKQPLPEQMSNEFEKVYESLKSW